MEFKTPVATLPLSSQTRDSENPGNSPCSGAPASLLYGIEGEGFHYLAWTEHFPLREREGANPLYATDWGRAVTATEADERGYTLSRDVGNRAGGPAPWLYLVSTDIPEDIVEEYVSWYDEEHLPRLVNVPGVRRARRYVSETGSPKFLTVYSLDAKDAFTSPEGLAARKTPWTARMRGLFTNTRRLTCVFLGPLPLATRGGSGNAQCAQAGPCAGTKRFQRRD